MEIRLGFGSIPRSQYIFVSRDADSCWYMLSEEERQIPIPEKALTGVVTGIECNRKIETKFGEAFKTDLSIMADKPYVIRSGRDSWFSRSLLQSLDSLTNEQLQRPLTIAVRPGDKKVVFCEIYDPVTFKQIDSNQNSYREIDLLTLEARVSSKIRGLQSSNQNNSKSAPGTVMMNPSNEQLRTTLFRYTEKYLQALGWTKAQGSQYLYRYYNQRSRNALTDVQLLDFVMKMQEILHTQQKIPVTQPAESQFSTL